MVFSFDYVFSSVVQFDPVNDECVIFSGVSFHILNGLFHFLIVVVPSQGRGRQSYYPTSKFGALAFVGESAAGLDDEPGGGLSAVCKNERKQFG